MDCKVFQNIMDTYSAECWRKDYIIMSNVLTRAGNKGSRRFHIHGEGPASSSSVDRTQIKVHCTENTQV